CGESFFRTTTEDGYVFTGERKHLNYFLNYSVPVILILCDPVTEKCWWCEIDPLETDETSDGWRITVPFNQQFDPSSKEKLAALAGASQDYLPQLQKYWAINKILQRPVSVLMVVALREDVEAGDISHTLGILLRLCASKRLIRKYVARVDVSILGYENDPRRLLDIPEVRTWV